MPEFRCPVGDFTARGSTVKDAALALSNHLLSQHCDMPTEGAGTLEGSLGDLEGNLDVDVSTRIDAAGERGGQR